MQRRTFLFQSGILVPALVVSPSAVLASSTAIKANILFIAGNDETPGRIGGIVDKAASSVQQLTGADIAEISYSTNGFSAKLKNGAVYTAEKMILHAAGIAIDTERLAVTVATQDDDISLNYNSGRNKQKPRPEFWSYTTEKFNQEQMQSFLNRKKHAFMCVS